MRLPRSSTLVQRILNGPQATLTIEHRANLLNRLHGAFLFPKMKVPLLRTLCVKKQTSNGSHGRFSGEAINDE